MSYTEIFKLKGMLEEANVPFKFTDSSFDLVGSKYRHYQIEYPCSYREGDRICSVIQGDGTYGREVNLLEIRGLLTSEEEQDDSVCGWLTAEDVFERIKAHYCVKVV